jgi:hypothetical protein
MYKPFFRTFYFVLFKFLQLPRRSGRCPDFIAHSTAHFRNFTALRTAPSFRLERNHTAPPRTHGAVPTLAVKPRDSPDPGPQARRRARGTAHGAPTHETLRFDDGTRNVHARTNVQPRSSDQHHQRPAHTTPARVQHEQGTYSTEPRGRTSRRTRRVARNACSIFRNTTAAVRIREFSFDHLFRTAPHYNGRARRRRRRSQSQSQEERVRACLFRGRIRIRLRRNHVYLHTAVNVDLGWGIRAYFFHSHVTVVARSAEQKNK